MKKIICLLGSLVLLMSVSITAFAAETVLTAEVPNAHTVTVTSEGGRVALDGAVCKDTTEMERHKEQSYRIIPDAGKLIDKVLYNGEDVTAQLEKGVFTAPKLVRDAELEVVYKNAPSAPDSKKYDIGGKVEDESCKPLPDVAVEIGGKMDETDGNGNFQIAALPSGTHQIVITDKDGNIIGHCPLIIVKSDENKLTLTVDENGDYVIKPRNDTKTIDLTLTVDEDGNVAVKNAADATVHSGTSPTTGDNSNLTMWYILMLVSAGIVFAVLIINRRRKVIE